jgi:hypothetical protein
MGTEEDRQVWIGVAGVVPRSGCELLSPDKEAYVNFLTLANSEAEYRAKVTGALWHYRLELLEFSSEEILLVAEQLKRHGNPQHVRYSTFHTFPRAM